MFERGVVIHPFLLSKRSPAARAWNILWQKYGPNVHNFKKIFELYTNKL